MRVRHVRDYRVARRDAFPSQGDQLDAIWEALASLGSGLPTKTQDMLAQVQAVKAKFPKPERRDADR